MAARREQLGKSAARFLCPHAQENRWAACLARDSAVIAPALPEEAGIAREPIRRAMKDKAESQRSRAKID
jgi:hypothetical protein